MRYLSDSRRAERLSVPALITQRTLRGKTLGNQSMWLVASASTSLKETNKLRVYRVFSSPTLPSPGMGWGGEEALPFISIPL